MAAFSSVSTNEVGEEEEEEARSPPMMLVNVGVARRKVLLSQHLLKNSVCNLHRKARESTLFFFKTTEVKNVLT